jgi:hypothetical protein
MEQTKMCWAPVAHTCNPCDSGGTDKEDHASKTAWENSFQDTLSKKGLVDCLKVESLSSSLRQLITVDLENSNVEKTPKSLSSKWYS